MNRHSSRLVISIAAASLVISFGVVASVSAASKSQGSNFYGCRNAKGNVNDISTWSGLTCPKGLTEVSWNGKGLKGSKGDQGQQGGQGPQGDRGPQGPQGPAGTPAVDPNVLYDSMTVASNYEWSQCFSCVQMGQFGNDVTLASYSGHLKHVIVSMADWDAASAVQPIAITLTLYSLPPDWHNTGPVNGDTPGSVIATSTVTVTPSASATGCAGGTYTTGCAPAFNVSFPFDVPLSSLTTAGSGDDIIYGISYNNNSVDGGLNVNMSYESSSVPSAGADSFPGWLWASLIPGYAYNGVGGATGQVTCATTVNTTFEVWNAVPTTYMGSCGEDSNTVIAGNLVPAVEFLAN